MAGAVPRQRCACLDCQHLVLEEMKGIPARFLPHSTRMRLSMILDPVKDLPGRDYRSFADRSGLTPDVWQVNEATAEQTSLRNQSKMWLDSQRTQNDTSSIGKVLKHLTDQHGNSYTVYHVYRTLCEMDSDGQRIILEDMREIRRLYNAESRPGQEHTEPSSVVMPPPSLVPGRDKDPPPPYHDEQQSDCMTGGAVGMTLSNLGVGCQPEENSFVSGGDHQTTYVVSFSDSQTSDNGRLVSPSPPSCLESQHIYNGAASRMTQPPSQSPTNMQNLKLPLGADCPQVHPGQNFSSRVNDLSNPQRSGHCYGAQQSQMTSLNIQPKPMDKSQPVQPPTLRPISFPYHIGPTYKMSLKSSPRPLSDANFCSHLGACSCKDVSVDVQSPCSVPRSHTAAPSSRALTSYSPSQEQCGQRMTRGSSASVSIVSCIGQPWNSGHHQTEAKHPLESNHQASLKTVT